MAERFPLPANKEDKEGTEETLRWIAKKILNEKGVSAIEEYILNGEMDNAKELLLGNADRLFENNRLNFEQASELYALIGVSPERASQLRQAHARGK
jgi:hypothetical protein